MTVLTHTALFTDSDPRTPNSLSYHYSQLTGPHQDTETAGYMAAGWGRGKRTSRISSPSQSYVPNTSLSEERGHAPPAETAIVAKETIRSHSHRPRRRFRHSDKRMQSTGISADSQLTYSPPPAFSPSESQWRLVIHFGQGAWGRFVVFLNTLNGTWTFGHRTQFDAIASRAPSIMHPSVKLSTCDVRDPCASSYRMRAFWWHIKM